MTDGCQEHRKTCSTTSRRVLISLCLANGEPVSVLDAIEADAGRFRGVRIDQMHALHDRPYLHGTLRDHLLHVSYFLSPVTRPAFHERGCSWSRTTSVRCHGYSGNDEVFDGPRRRGTNGSARVLLPGHQL